LRCQLGERSDHLADLVGWAWPAADAAGVFAGGYRALLAVMSPVYTTSSPEARHRRWYRSTAIVLRFHRAVRPPSVQRDDRRSRPVCRGRWRRTGGASAGCVSRRYRLSSMTAVDGSDSPDLVASRFAPRVLDSSNLCAGDQARRYQVCARNPCRVPGIASLRETTPRTSSGSAKISSLDGADILPPAAIAHRERICGASRGALRVTPEVTVTITISRLWVFAILSSPPGNLYRVLIGRR
jgi:hypothetical protein